MNVITFRATITTDCLALERTMEHASAANVFAKQAGRALIAHAGIALILAFLLVIHYQLTYVFRNSNNYYPVLGGGDICSGKGDCVCGECQCVEEDGGRYSGKYCEECPVCIYTIQFNINER